MAFQRKVFRIEQMHPLAAPTSVLAGQALSGPDQREILTELKALHDLIERRATDSPRVELSAKGSPGLRQLKDETEAIQRAIRRTNQEIASLRVRGFNGATGARASRELDAIVAAEERATGQILDAAEAIEEAANTLSPSLKHAQERALAQDIQDQAVRIFEACNFQDLSGQRISKVLATLQFVENHIARMMDIWSGITAFDEHVAAAPSHDGPLAHGPKLDGEPGHATQDEVDALFAAN
jgi:chemotaxis protein CheZ